jgi:putative ABC transport system ATP-binding protein
VLITHEPDVAAHAKRTIQLQDGQIVADRRVAGPGSLPPLLARQMAQQVDGPVRP